MERAEELKDKKVTVGGFGLKNLSLCYDESFGVPFDASLQVSDGRKVRQFKVHKFVLGLHSEELFRSVWESKKPLKIDSEDVEAFEVLLKFCYNIKDPLNDKSSHFLIAVYKEAERFDITELQDWILQQRYFSSLPIFNRNRLDLFQETVGLALETCKFPRLSEALYRRASRIKPEPTHFYMKKYRDNPQAYNQVIAGLGWTGRLQVICDNCKRDNCLNRTPVTMRNFVPGALVMVSDRRSGRGLAAIHRLDVIVNQQRQEFRGLLVSGIRTRVLTLDLNVYIYNCSNV